MKNKIAISLTKEVLGQVDRKIDGTNIRSRSQAIEVLVRKGLASREVDTVVMLLRKTHTGIPARPFRSSTVLEQQADFFRKNKIPNIYIVSQGEILTDKATVIRTRAAKNGDALREAKNVVNEDFVAMSGDVYNNFDIGGMIAKHLASGKLATIGLISSPTPGKYGAAVLEGDLVTAFEEKPKKPRSHVVNAGIYIFSPHVFSIMKGSIERNVLPELARRRQLVGYFTTGEYVHFGEGR